MTDSTGTPVFHLRSPKDWPRWLALIKLMASHEDVWGNIDPSIDKPPELVDPGPPKPKNAAGEESALSALTALEFEAYKIEREIWKAEKELYDRKKKSMYEIELYIVVTTERYWSSIENTEGVHAKMKALTQSVAPTNYALNRWLKANEGAKHNGRVD